jgi:hypothetical protein
VFRYCSTPPPDASSLRSSIMTGGKGVEVLSY